MSRLCVPCCWFSFSSAQFEVITESSWRLVNTSKDFVHASPEQKHNITMASLEEIAGLKAQIASLARDNDELRVAQVK